LATGGRSELSGDSAVPARTAGLGEEDDDGREQLGWTHGRLPVSSGIKVKLLFVGFVHRSVACTHGETGIHGSRMLKSSKKSVNAMSLVLFFWLHEIIRFSGTHGSRRGS
jgi:hypothetical protein